MTRILGTFTTKMWKTDVKLLLRYYYIYHAAPLHTMYHVILFVPCNYWLYRLACNTSNNTWPPFVCYTECVSVIGIWLYTVYSTGVRQCGGILYATLPPWGNPNNLSLKWIHPDEMRWVSDKTGRNGAMHQKLPHTKCTIRNCYRLCTNTRLVRLQKNYELLNL
jgi:hypothetical protein